MQPLRIATDEFSGGRLKTARWSDFLSFFDE